MAYLLLNPGAIIIRFFDRAQLKTGASHSQVNLFTLTPYASLFCEPGIALNAPRTPCRPRIDACANA
jgi:hypothetical protein